MARALTAARSGLRRFHTVSAFKPPPPSVAPPPAEPITNLFVSGKSPHHLQHFSSPTHREGRSATPSSGLRRFSTVFPFSPPPPAVASPPSEPSTNLFVSEKIVGLSKRTTSEGLRDAFAAHGEVLHARVVTDRVSGYSRGFGFVRYATLEDAANGIKGMDGKFLDGWVIFAEYARPRETQAPPTSEAVSNY